MRRDVQDRGDICILTADSRCCMAETNTILSSNYLPNKRVRIVKVKKFSQIISAQ